MLTAALLCSSIVWKKVSNQVDKQDGFLHMGLTQQWFCSTSTFITHRP